mmetsp:Transcript_124765/g.324122  ORF Transcript_124765/g.324122 Transcript_124765/m.324122 type:complete len:257 (+) Transcript_124765:82-852(+)
MHATPVHREHGGLVRTLAGHDEVHRRGQVRRPKLLHRGLEVRLALHDPASQQLEDSAAVLPCCGVQPKVITEAARVLLEGPAIEAHGSVDAQLAWPSDRRHERLAAAQKGHVHRELRVSHRLPVDLDGQGVVHVPSVHYRPVGHRSQQARTKAGVIHLVLRSDGEQPFPGHIEPSVLQPSPDLPFEILVQLGLHDLIPIPLDLGRRTGHWVLLVPACHGFDCAKILVVEDDLPPPLLWVHIEVHIEVRDGHSRQGK